MVAVWKTAQPSLPEATSATCLALPTWGSPAILQATEFWVLVSTAIMLYFLKRWVTSLNVNMRGLSMVVTSQAYQRDGGLGTVTSGETCWGLLPNWTW